MMSGEVRLQLVPTGESGCGKHRIQPSGDDVFRPVSTAGGGDGQTGFAELQDLDNAVFERNFRTFTLVFRPEDLLR